jgi:IS605 OrfB family transposase
MKPKKLKKSVKSYTCKISGNNIKLEFLEETLDIIQDLSWFIFTLGTKYSENWWNDHKTLYHHCRRFFPELNSKFVQNFIRYSYTFKEEQKPTKKVVKAGIFVDYQSFNFQINSNKLSNFWLRFSKRNFPLLGKYLFKKILEPEKVKLIQIFKNSKGLYCKLSYVEKLPDIKVDNPTKVVGLDINTKRMVLSNNIFYHIKRLYHRKMEHRKNNQQKRNLQNYTKNFIHKLTTQIANDLSTQEVEVLVLEDLRDLRKSASRKLKTSKSRKLNYIINSFPWGMFRDFLSYKCLDRSIKVELIQPAYTSKTCSKCGSRKTTRPRQVDFVCQDCKFQLDADLNGSRNISSWYTTTNALPVNLALAKT